MFKKNTTIKEPTAVLIPVINPDECLVALVKQLTDPLLIENFQVEPQILIVNDGTFSKKGMEVLCKLETFPYLQIIHHKKNLGKGSAIKTGIKFLEKTIKFIVTADGDGQHAASDIMRVLRKAIETHKFVLGTRDFINTSVPLKSNFGNKLTSFIFYIATKNRIKDTQTGLRAFPSHLFRQLIEIEGNRYDYEFNTLLEISKSHQLSTVPIKTIYLDQNKKSNFRPLRDSFLIYFIFARYFITALVISVLDFLLIYVGTLVFPVTYSFLAIRLITSHIYFYFMKTKVFQKSGNLVSQLILYYIFSLFNVLVSWQIFEKIFFVAERTFLLGYFAGTITMFFVNFLLQKYIIFK